MRVIQTAYLLGILVLAATGCQGQVNSIGKRKEVRSNGRVADSGEGWLRIERPGFSMEVPAGWSIKTQWRQEERMLLNVISTNFVEMNITSSDPALAGFHVVSGMRITMLVSLQSSPVKKDEIRTLATDRLRRRDGVKINRLDVSDIECWYGSWNYGKNGGGTGKWSGVFRTDAVESAVVNMSVSYAQNTFSQDDVNEVLKGIVGAFQYKGEE
jgi:hypothetical protein